MTSATCFATLPVSLSRPGVDRRYPRLKQYRIGVHHPQKAIRQVVDVQ